MRTAVRTGFDTGLVNLVKYYFISYLDNGHNDDYYG
jgi:hypothetical protein